jgi:hypothetical protein
VDPFGFCNQKMAVSSQLSDANTQRQESLPARKNFSGLKLSAIGSRLWEAFLNRVPVGYQDDAGFHLGTEPPQDKAEAAALIELQSRSLTEKAAQNPLPDYRSKNG